jgi:Family of unknown function (DUF5681)
MTKEYDVGYGKPPVASRFKPRQSGNPGGRKKGSKNLATVVKRAQNEKVTVVINGRRRSMTKLEAAITQLANKAASGDPKATQMLVDLGLLAEAREAADRPPMESDPDARNKQDRAVVAALLARFGDDEEV